MKNLKAEVKDWLNSYAQDERGSALDDLLAHGCASGMVPSLIYYEDTLAFYEKHKSEISIMLADTLADTGYTSPADLFGKKWDNADPLALDVQNQNLLAWFGFEQAAYQLQGEG